MTQIEFIGHMSLCLADFSMYWTTNKKKNPEVFPHDLDEVEWMEQFEAWMELTDDGKVEAE